MNNWVKFNQASLKLMNQNHRVNHVDFDSTLIKLRKNTTMIPKKIIYQPTKKYTRNQQFVKKVRNNKKEASPKNNCSSICLKLNFTGKKNYDRIHSHSVKLDSSGKIKIEPKDHFANFDKIIPKTDVK